MPQKIPHPLNHHIHIPLTHHIPFTFNPLNQPYHITNPFILETKSLYPKQYHVAKQVLQLINPRPHL
ncbi:PRD domain-containing protein, partial [Bacillus altitudinis]|uniref:PRD domain-containing protein n=1 Tax=Bacillus altitudinis TaxID=293387 RepID=UPI002354E292